MYHTLSHHWYHKSAQFFILHIFCCIMHCYIFFITIMWCYYILPISIVKYLEFCNFIMRYHNESCIFIMKYLIFCICIMRYHHILLFLSQDMNKYSISVSQNNCTWYLNAYIVNKWQKQVNIMWLQTIYTLLKNSEKKETWKTWYSYRIHTILKIN